MSCDTLLQQAFEKLAFDDEAGRVNQKDTASQPKRSEYVYSPIGADEFRLLEIQPGNFSDELVCNIFHLKTASTKQGMWYDAISYTWAGEDGRQVQDQDTIVSSGRLFGIQTLKATLNCDLALRRVRSMTAVVHVWVDALCINQMDLIERGHQVQQMQSIYANANTVHAYVGEAADESDSLMDIISRLESGQTWALYYELWSSSSQRNYFKAFLGRRWFSRVWCLQEIGMARQVNVICGNKTVPWTKFLLANPEYCQRQSVFRDILPVPHYRGMFPMILRLPTGGKQVLTPARLYRLLEDARMSCNASDPRDMVYTVLGLLENSETTGTLPDYEMKLGEVYNRTAEYLISQCNTLDFLSQAEFRGLSFMRTSPLATWAIDWSTRALRHSRTSQSETSQILGIGKTMDTSSRITFSTNSGSRRVLLAAGRVRGIVLSVFAPGKGESATHKSPSLLAATPSGTRESLRSYLGLRPALYGSPNLLNALSEGS